MPHSNLLEKKIERNIIYFIKRREYFMEKKMLIHMYEFFLYFIWLEFFLNKFLF